MNDPNANLKGQRFEKPKGPASLILEPMRDIIWMTLNCFWNPKILIKYLADDGVSTMTKDADIIMSPLGWTATIDATSLGGGGGGGGGGGSTGGNWNYRGAWTPTPPSPYMTFDVVSYGNGTAGGMYLSTLDGNTNAPDTGLGWVQCLASSGPWL